MPQLLKAFSQVQIEETIAKALSELTGATFEVNIHKIERVRPFIYDENAIELTVKSDFCPVFAAARDEEVSAN